MSTQKSIGFAIHGNYITRQFEQEFFSQAVHSFGVQVLSSDVCPSVAKADLRRLNLGLHRSDRGVAYAPLFAPVQVSSYIPRVEIIPVYLVPLASCIERMNLAAFPAYHLHCFVGLFCAIGIDRMCLQRLVYRSR